MAFFYNIFIHLLYIGIKLASYFNSKAKLWINGRKNIFIKIRQKVKNGEKIIWFHASSLGEFEQGRPVVELIREKHPEYKILLTFFSPSGYETAKDYRFADYIFYLPNDTLRNAKKFIEIVKPQLVFFIKYEFWLNYLRLIKKNNIPCYLFSAIFRKDQTFFKWYGAWYRSVLHSFTHIFVQNAQSAHLLQTFDIHNVSVAGDTRFDRVNEIAKQNFELPVLEEFKQNKKCLICGSTWEQDENILLRYIHRDNDNDIKIIIAPHLTNKRHIDRICKAIKVKYILYSNAEKKDLKDASVCIIDRIGILSKAYRYGDIAYIGGGFKDGIHNIIEAAVYGLPVIFGKKYKQFNEAVELIALKGAFSISGYIELKKCLHFLLNTTLTSEIKLNLLQQTSHICKDYVQKKLNASQKIHETVFGTKQLVK